MARAGVSVGDFLRASKAEAFRLRALRSAGLVASTGWSGGGRHAFRVRVTLRERCWGFSGRDRLVELRDDPVSLPQAGGDLEQERNAGGVAGGATTKVVGAWPISQPPGLPPRYLVYTASRFGELSEPGTGVLARRWPHQVHRIPGWDRIVEPPRQGPRPRFRFLVAGLDVSVSQPGDAPRHRLRQENLDGGKCG